MAVPISNVTRRQVYSPSGTGGAGPYSFTFEILANTDIAVYKDDTLLTLTTHYTVTINSNGTGSVTITAAGLALSPTSPTQYAIVGNRTIQRTTDFTTGGDFFANAINDELDQQTIFAQQNAEGLARALTAPQTDPTSINMTLPSKASRALKTLSFDSDGNPTPGVSASDVANAVTYATNAANSATAAASSASAASSSASSASGSASTASTQASNASTSASNAATSASGASTSATNAAASASTASTQASNASTSATNAASSASAASTSASNASSSASAASTSASNAATAQTAAEAARDSALAAYDNFDDRYLGAKSSNPTLDNDGNALLAGALYFNTVVPEMRLWTGSAWVAAYVSGSGFVDLTSSQTIAGTKTFSSNPILSGGTANGIPYLNGSKVLTTGSALVFDGTNLGVGVTPSSRLTTSGTTGTGNGLTIIDTDYSNDTHQIYGNNSLHLSAGTGGAGAILFKTGGSERARIDSSGRLGIGTTTMSTSENLVVSNGTVDLVMSPGAFSSGNTAMIGTKTNHGISFAINTAQKMAIDTSGNLLVGTATGASSTSALMQLKKGGVQWDTGPNGSNGSFNVLKDATTGVYLTSGATAWSGLSDETMKDIIEPIENASQKISTLRTVIGKYKTDEEGTRRAFLIAQDVKEVLPEAVNENENGKLGLQYTDVMPLLVAAIKEQQALIQSLTDRISALEGAKA